MWIVLGFLWGYLWGYLWGDITGHNQAVIFGYMSVIYRLLPECSKSHLTGYVYFITKSW